MNLYINALSPLFTSPQTCPLLSPPPRKLTYRLFFSLLLVCSFIAVSLPSEKVSAQGAQQNTINVDATCSLAEAIASANNDNAGASGCEAGNTSLGVSYDVIVIQSGTIITLSASLPAITDTLYIESSASPFPSHGPFDVIIDGGAQHSIFTTRSTLILSGLHLRNGRGTNGAALKVETADALAFVYARFTGNQATQDGGAVYFDGSSIYSSWFQYSEFSDNRAGRNGGAIYYADGVQTVKSRIALGKFTNNRAGLDGGAIYHAEGQIQIYDNVFNTNSATGNGGAIAKTFSESVVAGSIVIGWIRNSFSGNTPEDCWNFGPCPWTDEPLTGGAAQAQAQAPENA